MTGVLAFLLLGGLWSVVVVSAVDSRLRRLAVRVPVQTTDLALGSGAPVWLKDAAGQLDHVVGKATMRAHREARQRDRAVIEQLPDVVDLLRLAAEAGLPVASAIIALESRPGGPLGEAFRVAAIRLDRGATTVAVLVEIPDTAGPVARSLVEVLVDHDRYGTPLGPALDRLGVESRLWRRRQGEEAARRLPVLLLFPLVLCTLPACVLLAIVPLLVGSFSSLPL